jgi:polyferredoxin
MARRVAPVVRARIAFQLGFLVLVIILGVRFSLWVSALLAGRAPALGRPPGVEGFLPISALMSFRLWLAGGGVHSVHPAALAIFLAIVAMSALVAKSFCSHLCPVGAVSEWLGRLGARLLGRTWLPPRWLDIPLRALRYVLLAFFVWATWVAMGSLAVQAFLDSPYNKVADVKMLLFFAHPSELTIAVLGVLVVGSLLVRDLWCRYLCPYGALLGLVGRFAPLKVTRDPSTCIDCEKCTRVCPARLTVHTSRRVCSVECTSCQDCVAACPVTGCLSVQPPAPVAHAWRFHPAAVVGLAIGVYVAVLFVFILAGKWHGSVSEEEYATRLRDIDSPVYTHVGGLAATEPARSAPAHPEPNGRP